MLAAAAATRLEDDRRARERLCVATRLVRPVDELLRLVVAPDGTLVPDLKRRLPGRGVWVTATRATFDEAVRRKAFARSLKRPVVVPAGLGDTVDGLLERAALDMLSLANKAGLVVAGHAKVNEMVAAARAVAVLQAGDGAPDGARKLAAAVRRAYLDRQAPASITIFSSGQISLALGRANVIHAALGAGPASGGFLERAAALTLWRNGGLASAGLAAFAGDASQIGDEPFTDDAGPETDEGIATLD